MARIRKEYKMTEKNVEYIEEVKEKNNLKYSSEAVSYTHLDVYKRQI